MNVSWLVVSMIALPASTADVASFQAAAPVWPRGRETEMNVTVGFRAIIETPKMNDGVSTHMTLRVAASPLYRVFVNGVFLGCGPARGPHGYYRVDAWDLSGHLAEGTNVIAIEAAGYNSNSYYLLDQPSFLQAEVLSGNTVLAATGAEESSFKAAVLPERVQKVQRYSFQRPFTEVYRLEPGYDAWRRDPKASFKSVSCAAAPAKQLLPRRVSYPDFAVCKPVAHVASGQLRKRAREPRLWKDRSLTQVGPKLKGYPEDALDVIPSITLQGYRNGRPEPVGGGVKEMLRLKDEEFHILDFGINRTGFIGASVVCSTPTTLYFTFDEILRKGDVDFKRLGCVNIVSVELAPGTYDFETIEPYTLRYLKLIALEGECEVRGLYLREYKNPDAKDAQFTCSDERLERLFEAGVETFAQNCLDIFMDCPSRERAGWLCDSFFMARVAFDVSEGVAVEHNFIENFLLPDSFAHLPKGMLPMCYPADHYDGVFIPNWALWFVVQLEEYAERSGDAAMIAALKPKVLDLFAYFAPFQNEDGLLESLKSWVFVEWSAANRFVQDVNYPSNMLYAGALDVAGRLFDMPELEQQAENIRRVIRKQSFDGTFFVDNAVRKEGKLVVTDNRSEVCQYFAFFFGVATAESHGELWRVLRDEFGPGRKESGAYPEVHEANSFIGNMLRIELLSEAGLSQQILDESVAFLMYMAERTGTLWENVHDEASCNHGFASHIIHTLYRDILGLYAVDPIGKKVRLRFADTELNRCSGTVPTADGPVRLEWERDGKVVQYRLDMPEGYEAVREAAAGDGLVVEER